MEAGSETRPVMRRESNFIVEENLEAVRWPHQCVVCGGPAEQTDTLALRQNYKGIGEVRVDVAGIPYCQVCWRKARAGKRLNQAVWIGTVLLGIPLAILFGVLAMRSPSVRFVFCGMLVLLAFLTAYGIAWLLVKLPIKLLFRNRIVEPVDAWLITEKKRDGRDGVSIVIQIPNKSYADAFARVNGLVAKEAT